MFLFLLALAVGTFIGCPNELELVAINIKASKVNYTVGESVAPSDIEVVATYRDGTSKAVSGFTVTPATFSEAGTITVTVSYSENGVTKTASYEVTVNDVVPPTPSTFTVTFYANNDGATGTMEPQTFTEGQEQALATCGFSLNGYNFLGWTKVANATNKGFNDGQIIIVTENMELYAVWEKIPPEYVEFGLWPRTIKDPAVTVEETYSNKKEVGMFTYYQGSDNEWYCEALENAYGEEEQYKYSNGEKVARKGDYSYQWFKVEPIKWRVLTDNYSGKKLLFAEEGLYASIAYYDDTSNRTIDEKTIYPNNYKHSKIRA